jgi:hypothetical protein
MTEQDAPEDGAKVTVVEVPDDKAQAVLDFLDTLQSEEDDVTGHMINRGLAGGVVGGLGAMRHNTMTACWKTHQMGGETDYSCSDSDK